MPAKKKDIIRAFVALDLDPMSLRRVARVSDRLRMASGAPRATWTPTAQLHVTLKFMGELETKAVAALGKALATLAEGEAAPSPSPMRLEAFPSTKDARTIVVDLVDADGSISKLAAKVEKLTAKHGVPKDDREYRPHVTLARLRLEYDTRRWMRPDLATDAGDCRAAGLTLFRSDLSGEAAVYVPLVRCAFAVVGA